MDYLLAFELASNAANRCFPDRYVMVKVGLSVCRDGDQWFVAHFGTFYEGLTKDEAINTAMGILIRFYAPVELTQEEMS